MAEEISTEAQSPGCENSDPKHANGRFNQAHPEGGVILLDPESIATKTIKEILWKMGKSILSGQFSDLMKIGTPAQAHSNKTYLHMITKDIGYFEHFVSEAMRQSSDPIWKLKNLILTTLVSIQTSVENGSKTPLNPILGETLYQESANGTKVYCEQTSHHPPISHFLIEGPANLPFRVYGYLEYKVAIKGAFTKVEVSSPGKITLELPDKTTYTAQSPHFEVEGLLTTEKILSAKGQMKLRDLTNNYECQVTFDVAEKKRATGFMSFFSSTPGKTKAGASEFRKDLMRIEILKINEDEGGQNLAQMERVAFATGSYLEKITYEGEDAPIWSINHNIPRMQLVPPSDHKLILPSDSSQRLDAQALLREDWQTAEDAKHELEQRQREDKKIRTEYENAREARAE